MCLRSSIAKLLNNNVTVLYRSVSTSSVGVQQADIDEYSLAKPYSQIPSPKGLPLLGNALQMGSKENQINAVQFHKQLVKELGPIYKFKLPSMDIVIVTLAEDSQHIYNKDGRYPSQAGFEVFDRVRSQHLKDLYSTPGLFGKGEEWSRTRKLVQQDMMRPKSAMHYIDELSDIVDEVIANIEAGVSPDMEMEVSNMMHEYALEATGAIFIGTRLGVLKGDPYGKEMINNVKKVVEQFFTMNIIPAKIAHLFPIFREYINTWKTVYLSSKEKIDQAIDKHKVDGSLEGTILAKLVERCGPGSDIPHIMSNDALLAGVDSTGNTASFLLYHMAVHPDKQEKLYDEIVRVVGKDGKMTESALAEMRYLKACQTESARIAPTAMGTSRNAGEDMVLSGYQIPKGTFLLRLGVLMSNDDKYFNQPHCFTPERWIRGCPEYVKQKNAFANIPFGHGPRACIGQRFARLELYILLYKLVQKYRISYHGPQLGISYLGMGHLTGPLRLKFE